MLTYEQALRLAEKKLAEVSENDPDYVIWEEKTIEKKYGWIFQPATHDYIRTKNPMSLVPGIGPILVNRNDSTCVMIPSSVSPETFLKDYEENLEKK